MCICANTWQKGKMLIQSNWYFVALIHVSFKEALEKLTYFWKIISMTWLGSLSYFIFYVSHQIHFHHGFQDNK